ncbi:hypothetical protein YW7DRAFT_05809 [Streptomyces sp. AmelKG-E11A]|nr:hypothetical protein YW7DRAFT_05809 [Streptomyces sp. AmelKG-E11A]
MIGGDPSGSAVPTVSSAFTELHGIVIHRGEVAHLMPEPSLRLLPQHPWPAAPGSPRGTVLLRDRGQTDPKEASAPHGGDSSGGTEPSGPSGNGSGSGSDQDNPFAPPPEGSPDQPWRPRPPEGSGDGSGKDGQGPWGNQWSDQQPGRSGGRFGERPGQQGGGQDGPPSGMRWDPADPGQRRARYALLTGMWAFFFALFSWPYVALLLGALAVYWGISAVRGVPARGSGDAEAGGRTAPATASVFGPGSGSGSDAGKSPAAAAGSGSGSGGKRPQTTAAISGIVTGGLALAIVAATFTAQLVYQDYYVCARDALTVPAEKSCEDLLPKDLRPLLGVDE